MTRINLLPVSILLDQHLLAEYRELPMVGAAIPRSTPTSRRKIPESYILGTGHVKFFYNKLPFLEQRWKELVRELKKRGFKINPKQRQTHFDKFYEDEQIEWQPNNIERRISADRIYERYKEQPGWYKYYGESCPNYKRMLQRQIKEWKNNYIGKS